MKILALDTATENCSAALLLEGRLAQREAWLARGHAEHLLPMIQSLLQEAGIGLVSLNAIAFGRGPGGFTGVRLAASVTQGLAFGAGVPVIPISDLQALAQRVLDEDPGSSRVLICTDARMQEVYSGSFARGEEGRAVPASPERVGKPAAVQLPQAWHPGSGVVGAGSGFAAYPELGAQVSRVREGLWPRAAEIAQLAAAEAAAGRLLGAEEAIPVYLRDDVAQVPRRVP